MLFLDVLLNIGLAENTPVFELFFLSFPLSKWPFPIFSKERCASSCHFVLDKNLQTGIKEPIQSVGSSWAVNYSKIGLQICLPNQMLSHHFNKGEGETNIEHLVIHDKWLIMILLLCMNSKEFGENQIITTINSLHPEHVFLALTFLKWKIKARIDAEPILEGNIYPWICGESTNCLIKKSISKNILWDNNILLKCSINLWYIYVIFW